MSTVESETCRFALRLLGSAEARIAGEPMPPLKYRKEFWLLSLLALRNGREIQRNELTALLYPDNEQELARYYLRRSLTNLRRALGSESERLLAPTPRTLRLDLTKAFCDVSEFDRLIGSASETDVERAVGLYGGGLLPGCLEEWVLPERRLREDRWLDGMARLAQWAQQRGEPASAANWLRRLLQADPLRESAACALMQCLADSGDRAAVRHVYAALRDTLYRELHASPSPETERLYQSLCEREALPVLPALAVVMPLSETASRRHLPVPLTDLIGREREIEQARGWLRSRRLVTLLGPGGVGKTRLSIAVAESLLPDFPDGVYFVDFAPVTSADALTGTLARTLEIPVTAAAEEDLCTALGERKLLLVLDNCEHLADACATLAHRLLSRCPSLKLLATSRHLLGVTGEQVCSVPSLSLPSLGTNDETASEAFAEKDPSALLEYDGIRLFVQRAVAANPSFRLDRRNLTLVADICRRLDGIPLALEMAAARTRSLSLSEIAAKLSDRFRLLTGGSKAALPRHRTLRAALDWSYDLLTDDERTLLDRLSVFVGSCTLDSAAAVGDEEDSLLCLNRLDSLVEKSLLICDAASDTPRYRLLDTMRQYGAERLRERGEWDAARDRHRAYFRRFASGISATIAEGHGEDALERLNPDVDNVTAALDWSLERKDDTEAALTLCAGMFLWWQIHAIPEGRRWLMRCLELADWEQFPHRAARLLNNLSRFCYFQGDCEEANVWAEQGLRLARTLDDPTILAHSISALAKSYAGLRRWQEAVPLFEESERAFQHIGYLEGAIFERCNRGLMFLEQGDRAQAYRLLEEGLAQFRERGLLRGVGFALHSLSFEDYHRGDLAQAEARAREALTVHHALEDAMWELVNWQHLGWVYWRQGNRREAFACCHASLRLQSRVRRKQDAAAVLQCLAFLAFDAEQWRDTARLLGAELRLREEMKMPAVQFHQEEYAQRRQEAQDHLGATEWRRHWDAGRQMTWEECIGFALAFAASPALSDAVLHP
jgi:predicted ATPase/DNA-binding SARP family transcriptional activator